MNEKNQDIAVISSSYTLLDVPEDKFVELDLGCGKGGFSCSLAKLYPERLVIASDIMLGRLRRLRNKKKSFSIENMEIVRAESRHLLKISLPDSSISRIHVLCPDPWPKTRHGSKRLFCSEIFSSFARVLKNGGVLHFSTDDSRYFEETAQIAEISGIFLRDDSLHGDIAGIMTDFERNWLSKGREVWHASWKL